ncbi:MAG: Holliday junction resolvase RuvX [Candidatus Omnitrophica bacterium]|nr:Holliday junction resolvase RuvX [Candidatus Omnitrophota bacterium]
MEKTRVLGLDLGEKRIGVAVSDEFRTIARGLGTIEVNGKEIERIKEIVTQYNIGKIVYGVPLKNDGSLSGKAEKMLSIITRLKAIVKVEFIPWDERMTTIEAENILLMADLSRKKRKRVRDKLAAQIILQSYLDSLYLKNSPVEE